MATTKGIFFVTFSQKWIAFRKKTPNCIKNFPLWVLRNFSLLPLFQVISDRKVPWHSVLTSFVQQHESESRFVMHPVWIIVKFYESSRWQGEWTVFFINHQLMLENCRVGVLGKLKLYNSGVDLYQNSFAIQNFFIKLCCLILINSFENINPLF